MEVTNIEVVKDKTCHCALCQQDDQPIGALWMMDGNPADICYACWKQIWLGWTTGKTETA